MRARSLKPGFFKNEYLAELGPFAQLLFEGLWCLADREGKLEDRPKRIKAEIFPYYDPQPGIDTLLYQLHETGFIIRYTIEGLNLIKILNFTKHQSPHSTEKASTYPNPPKDLEALALINESTSVGSRKHNALTTDTLTTDSLGTPLAGGSRRTTSADPSPPSGLCIDGEPVDGDKPQNDTHIKAAPGESEVQGADDPPVPEVLNGGNGDGVKVRFTPNDLARLWNETADPAFPRVIVPLSEKRIRKFRPAVRAQPDPEWWKALFRKAGGINFLRGENNRGWRADLEFVVKSWEKILEGKYGEPKEQDGSIQADPNCPVCQGDGREFYDENGEHLVRPCQCLKKRAQYAGKFHTSKQFGRNRKNLVNA